MCLFIVANNIYFAGFNRMHFHNYPPRFILAYFYMENNNSR